ncbi:hypothetical protein [Ralstonia mojiangensis]|uniref:hypothetical protein n=1 Tax=Ralstonia mojiangensis TaxID=2953895 RepID=UPI0021B23FD2|nr:hypothetical protein [Ralstonia mojiangensis]MCT7325480.1 hypothetical protein [Ralstonia mojiangensis]
MKVVGLFRELSGSANQTIQTIHDVVGGLPWDNVPAVVTYLQSGVPVFDVMEASVDPFDKSVQIPGGPSLISDGFWIWRNDLAYFVEKYRVGLPEEFILHALHCGVASVDRLLIAGEWEKILEEYELAEKGGGD